MWSGAADNLASTAPQAELLDGLISKFNGAGSVEERFNLVAHFLVEAAQIEAVDGSVTRYDLYQVGPGSVCFIEDYPLGSDAHSKSLATAVLRWTRFEVKEPTEGRLHSMLMEMAVDRWENEAERDSSARWDSMEAPELEDSAVIMYTSGTT